MQFKEGQLVRRISAPDGHILGIGSVCKIDMITSNNLVITVLKPFPGKSRNETWPIGHSVIYPKRDFVLATKRLKRKQNVV